jgi:hypothetical protein
MSKSRNKERSAKPPATAAVGRRPYRLAVLVIAVAVVAAAGFWWSKDRQAGTPPAATPNSVFEKLTGRWQRPDGGYIIEVRSVEPGGRMNAAYFNPRPINVAKAQASQDSGTVKIFIELRDVNYPGSTYNLTYDPADDRLKGIYFQAAIEEAFEVYFVRLQP